MRRLPASTVQGGYSTRTLPVSYQPPTTTVGRNLPTITAQPKMIGGGQPLTESRAPIYSKATYSRNEVQGGVRRAQTLSEVHRNTQSQGAPLQPLNQKPVVLRPLQLAPVVRPAKYENATVKYSEPVSGGVLAPKYLRARTVSQPNYTNVAGQRSARQLVRLPEKTVNVAPLQPQYRPVQYRPARPVNAPPQQANRSFDNVFQASAPKLPSFAPQPTAAVPEVVQGQSFAQATASVPFGGFDTGAATSTVSSGFQGGFAASSQTTQQGPPISLANARPVPETDVDYKAAFGRKPGVPDIPEPIFSRGGPSGGAPPQGGADANVPDVVFNRDGSIKGVSFGAALGQGGAGASFGGAATSFGGAATSSQQVFSQGASTSFGGATGFNVPEPSFPQGGPSLGAPVGGADFNVPEPSFPQGGPQGGLDFNLPEPSFPQGPQGAPLRGAPPQPQGGADANVPDVVFNRDGSIKGVSFGAALGQGGAGAGASFGGATTSFGGAATSFGGAATSSQQAFPQPVPSGGASYEAAFATSSSSQQAFSQQPPSLGAPLGGPQGGADANVPDVVFNRDGSIKGVSFGAALGQGGAGAGVGAGASSSYGGFAASSSSQQVFSQGAQGGASFGGSTDFNLPEPSFPQGPQGAPLRGAPPQGGADANVPDVVFNRDGSIKGVSFGAALGQGGAGAGASFGGAATSFGGAGASFGGAASSSQQVFSQGASSSFGGFAASSSHQAFSQGGPSQGAGADPNVPDVVFNRDGSIKGVSFGAALGQGGAGAGASASFGQTNYQGGAPRGVPDIPDPIFSRANN